MHIPLDDPGLEALGVLDLESFHPHEIERASQHVLALNADHHLFEQPLDVPPEPRRRGDVIDQEQPPVRPSPNSSFSMSPIERS